MKQHKITLIAPFLLALGIMAANAWAQNPTPYINEISPAAAQALSGAVMLTVNGTGYVPGAVVNWRVGTSSTTALTTTFVSATELRAAVPSYLVSGAGRTASVWVENPSAPASNVKSFQITAPTANASPQNPTPYINSISPVAAPEYSSFTLTVNGTGFVPGMVVGWKVTDIINSSLTTTFVSATELKAVVPASFVAAPGTASVMVVNPSTVPESASNVKSFQITVPTVTKAQPPASRSAAAAVGILFAVIAILSLAFYIYAAVCLQVIAKKTNTANGWLAWIPIANVVLMLNIAQKPLWWVLLLLIPVLNIVIAVIVWMQIAKARAKAEWWGVMVVVPVMNFIAPGYLAFST